MQQFNYDFIHSYIEGMKKEGAVLMSDRNKLRQKIFDINTEIDNKTKTQANLQMIVSLLNKASSYARSQCKDIIENFVTNALQYITGRTNVKFKIDLNIDKISADCYLEVDTGTEISKQDIFKDSAGGMRDIISTALRIIYLILYNHPNVNRILVLDEPGKQVSEQASVKLAEFLKLISKNYNIQIIMVTHNSNLKNVADKLISVGFNQQTNESVVTSY